MNAIVSPFFFLPTSCTDTTALSFSYFLSFFLSWILLYQNLQIDLDIINFFFLLCTVAWHHKNCFNHYLLLYVPCLHLVTKGMQHIYISFLLFFCFFFFSFLFFYFLSPPTPIMTLDHCVYIYSFSPWSSRNQIQVLNWRILNFFLK
jgi:hypothetical protein